MDHSVVLSLNHLLVRHDALEDPVTLYERFAELLFSGALVVAFLFAAPRVRRTVVAAGLSAAGGLAVAALLARVVDRRRPFVADPRHVHLFAAHAADAGFPSDHATAAFAIGVAIVLRHRAAGVVVLVLAAVLAVGRVAIGVHYPSDVLAGALLGAAVAVVLSLGPLRREIDRLADVVGGALDGIAGRHRVSAGS